MSPRLPVLTARQILAVLQRHGFVQTRQNGSLIILKHPDGRRTTVPMQRAMTSGVDCSAESCKTPI